MIFSFGGNPQQIKEQQEVQEQATRMCESHPGCVDCELKIREIKIGNSVVTCITGKSNK